MWLKFSDKKPNLGEVVGELAKGYDLPEKKIMIDAQSFLNKALDLKLIQLI